MKTLLFLFIVISCLTNIDGQLPYTESFETGMGYTPDVDVIDNLSDYFARMNTECNPSSGDPCEVEFSAGYSGWDGDYYWAGEDHDDSGVGGTGNQTLCITLDAIDISANTTGVINIAVMAAANTTGNAYDPTDGDGIYISYAVDGASSQAVHTWGYYTPDGGTTERLAYDDNNNGLIDGAESDILTATFETKDRDITVTGNNLVITICAHSNSSSEEWAVDNIVVTAAAAAPVEMTQFVANKKNDGILLTWETSTEINNDGFEIQSSVDGINWSKLGYVTGNGNSLSNHHYEFVDEKPNSGLNYYRLKQIDFDGKFQYSKVVSINFHSEKKVWVYPNPSNQQINIHIENPLKENIQIIVTDNIGKEIWESGIIKEEINVIEKIDLREAGIYFMITQIGSKIYQEKILILNGE